MAVSVSNQTTRALGIAIVDDRIELHGLNQFGDVVLHGWFAQEAGILILCRQPHCVIALDAHSVPALFATTLETMGHSTILVTGDEIDVTPPRSARALAHIAMTAVCNPVPRYSPSSSEMPMLS